MKRLIRIFIFALFGAFLGSFGRRLLLRYLWGYDVHPSARIGYSIIDSVSARFGPGSSVGHFSVIRNLDNLLLSENARIGTFNWIFGAPTSRHFRLEVARRSALILHEGASITSRHLIDCTDTVEIGEFSTIAGFRSQILTHSIDISLCRQSCAPVRVGKFSFVGTGSVILKGSVFPDQSVLSAGSVFSGRGHPPWGLYQGNPAKSVREISKDSGYMLRIKSRVE